MSTYGEAERFLADTIGLDPEVMGARIIKSEVDFQMKSLGIDDVGLCLKELMQDKDKMGRFIERIVVPETWFFRDRESFKLLKRYVHDRAAGKEGNPLRILSAPCSTGEEPYSIAMTMCEAGLLPGSFQVDAVDISRKSLKIARRAEYGKASFRGETKHFEGYFDPVEDRMRLSPRVAGLVNFYHDNVLRKGFFADHEPYHIVFCKNLLIYLHPEARRKLCDTLTRLLLPGGILFTGHSELASFLQFGYHAVPYSRSFACTKPDRDGKEATPAQLSVPAARKRLARPLLRRIGDDESFPGRSGNDITVAPEFPKVEKDKNAADSQHDLSKLPLDAIRSLADRGSLDEASDLCTEYLKSNGTDKEAHCLMGLISHARNRLEKAERSFQKALYLDPGHYETLLHMSLLYDRKGDRVKADILRQRLKRIEDGERSGRKGL